MDRLSQLRGEAGSSRDVSLNSSSAASEEYLTANESSSKYYSLSEVDSTLDSPIKDPIKDVSLASAAADTTDGTISTPNQLISDLSPIKKKSDLLDSFKIGKHIEASNILSGGIDIFDDNDNSYDGNELVIDDVCMDLDDKSNSELKIDHNLSEEFPKESMSVDTETEIPSKDTEVVLHIDGKNVDAIDIGNGLYLYRKGGAQEELAAVQIIDADQPQPSFKFLKVRENVEGNLEVYEEIEVEVPKEVPSKAAKSTKSNVSHVPIKDINKVITEPMSHKAERKIVSPPKNTIPQVSTPSDVKNKVNEGTTLLTEHKNEVNFNGKPVKINEAKKSPVIGSFTPMTFHSTPNKEGIPLTKTMVNQQLHPNRHSDNVKKTIEVLTDCTKQKITELPNKDEHISSDGIKATSINVVDNTKPENVFEILPSSLAVEKEGNKCDTVKSSINEKSSENETETTSPNNENLLNPNEGTITTIQKELPKEHFPEIKENDFPEMPEEINTQTHEAKSSQKDQKKPERIVRESLEELKSLEKDVSKETSKEEMQTPKTINEVSEAIEAPIKVSPIASPSKVDILPEDIRSSTNFLVDSIKADHTLSKTDEPKVAEVSPKDCSESTVVVESAKTDNRASKISNVAALSKLIETVPKMEISLNEIVSQSNQSEASSKNVEIKSAKDLSKPVDIPLKLEEYWKPTGPTPEIKTQPKNQNNPDKASYFTKNNEVQLIPGKQVVLQTSNVLISKIPQQISDKSIVEVKPIPTLNMFTKTNETVVSGDAKTQSIQSETVETSIKVSTSEVSKNETSKGDDKNNISDDLIQLTDLGIETAKDKSVELQNKAFADSLASDKIIQSVPIVNKIPEVMKVEPVKATDIKQFNARTSVAMPFTVKSSGDDKNKYLTGIPLMKNKIYEDNNFITKQVNKALIIRSSASSSQDTAIINKPGASTLAKGSIQITSNLCIKKQDVPEIKVTPVGAQTDTKPKSINNNNAVPFGKWTEANKQAYLSRIKETKVFNPNANQIKQCNDLNRRDVLKKMDSQRISNSIASRTQEMLNKVNIKHESGAFVNKNTVKHDHAAVKAETVNIKPETFKQDPKPSGSLPGQNLQAPKISGIPHSQTLPTNPMISKSSSSSTITKIEPMKNEIPAPKRTEINNQDLIDRTIEDILNDKTIKIPRASEIETVPNTTKVEQKEATAKDKQKTPTKPKFDEIELKMNELHGIPFIERPPHELPTRYNPDLKTITKTSTNSKRTTPKADKITKPVPPKQQSLKPNSMEVDEEEILEHEPVTGDMDLTKNIRQIAPQKSLTVSQTTVEAKAKPLDVNKDAVITEKDFDKFARRTSITYDNSITVNYDDKKQRNMVKSMVERDVMINRYPNVPPKASGIGNPSYNSQQMVRTYGSQSKPSNALPIRVEEGYNKNSQSKFQIAYQSALTAKRQKEPPISVIEDKPVKVVFMDHNTEYATTNLNVQGKELSPAKKPKEPEKFPLGSCDSLDCDVVGVADEAKLQKDSKKPKHQRKQVLTPVETPEMEILDPVEFTDDSSANKKRKMEETSKSIDTNKSPKSILPKKTYLLGRTALPSEPQNVPICAPIETPAPPLISNAASAIDNLVKAAELLETQSQNMSMNISSSQNSPQTPTPIKRGRGRPRKNPLSEGVDDKNKPATHVSPQKKLQLTKTTQKHVSSSSEDSSDDEMAMENWTMGKINEKIVCPICNKLFRSENVVFKHVKHCTGPSPNRSDSDKRSSRRGRSMESENSSQDAKTSDTESSKEDEKLKKLEPNMKQGTSDAGHKPKSIDNEVIVIADTPLKTRSEKRDMATQSVKRNELRKSAITKAKVQQRSNNLVCEFCGKAFRQLSYLVSHKLQHKNEEPKKPEVQSAVGSVFSCEVCKKEFRKLHHLVQHRIIHNPTDLRSRRKSSAEQSETKTKPAPEVNKAVDDGSAGFRCEPCDKSFRKLHHLVEHRETHDGINRQKSTPATQTSPEKVAEKPPSSPPQCEICKKTFRKLHHLIEHKEQHIEVGSEKSDDKSVKSALSTKDIIHECSLCYMVFPNEHSLNKHSVNCQRKKRQSLSKLPKPDSEEQAQQDQDVTIVDKAVGNASKIESENIPKVSEIKVSEKPIEVKTIEQSTNSSKLKEPKVDTDDTKLSSDETIKMSIEAKPKTTQTKTSKENKSTPKRKEDDHKTIETKPLPPKIDTTPIKKAINDVAEKPKNKNPEIIETIVIEDTPIKKVGPKDKLAATVTRRQKSTNTPSQADKKKISSDDDEVRYMLNPNFKPEETSESKVFMKVRAQKRNSLQLERPNSKELIKRRTSLQNPPKMPRLKPKTESKLAPVNELRKSKTDEPKYELVPSTDSDDSEVKYAFPEHVVEKKSKPVAKPDTATKVEKKLPRKSLADKRKSLGGIAKRKSMGKAIVSKAASAKTPAKNVVKRRSQAAEHRCDCGQLFSSAALLSRHTTLTHTPPRIRRRRSPPPEDNVKKTLPKTSEPTKDKSARKSSVPQTVNKVTRKSSDAIKSAVNARKSSVKNDAGDARSSRKSSVRSDVDKAIELRVSTDATPSKQAKLTASSAAKPKTGVKVRKSAAHRGVPVPEKMRKLMENMNK